eukprot:12921096-Prorocentrum_lima.AAC.1
MFRSKLRATAARLTGQCWNLTPPATFTTGSFGNKFELRGAQPTNTYQANAIVFNTCMASF